MGPSVLAGGFCVQLNLSNGIHDSRAPPRESPRGQPCGGGAPNRRGGSGKKRSPDKPVYLATDFLLIFRPATALERVQAAQQEAHDMRWDSKSSFFRRARVDAQVGVHLQCFHHGPHLKIIGFTKVLKGFRIVFRSPNPNPLFTFPVRSRGDIPPH